MALSEIVYQTRINNIQVKVKVKVNEKLKLSYNRPAQVLMAAGD